jgi:hypothetical protein
MIDFCSVAVSFIFIRAIYLTWNYTKIHSKRITLNSKLQNNATAAINARHTGNGKKLRK